MPRRRKKRPVFPSTPNTGPSDDSPSTGSLRVGATFTEDLKPLVTLSDVAAGFSCSPDAARDIALKMLAAATLGEGVALACTMQREGTEMMIKTLGDRFEEDPEEYILKIQAQMLALWGQVYQDLMGGK